MKVSTLINMMLSVSLLLLLTNCNDEPTNPVRPEPPTGQGRTILVYQVANNNLGSPSAHYDSDDIDEMIMGVADGALSADDRLLVYNAGYRRTPVLMEVTTTGLDTLKTYSTDIFSVDSRRMLEVLDDMTDYAPAADYGLVLWSHGSGWVQDGITDPADKGVKRSFGSDNGRTMNVTTLARTLEQGPELAWIYFDCCFMMSVETLYELRRCAPHILGSATELLVYGQPYHLTLKHLFSKATVGLVSAAGETFKLYDESFTGANRTCTMSVVATDKLEELAEITAEIYSHASVSWPEGYAPQRFENAFETSCRYFDFAHYASALCFDASGNERFSGANGLYERWNDVLNASVLYRAATPRLWNALDIKSHCGLSTYILREPQSAQYRNYCNLEWYDNVASKIKFKEQP